MFFFSSIFSNKKQKRKALQFYEKGLFYSQYNLYFLSSFYFNLAWHADKKHMSKRLEELMEASLADREDSSMLALASGIIVLRQRKKDAQLANKLGVHAAMNNLKMAKNLFKKAILWENLEIARLNLAALEAKIPLYGDVVQKLYEKYITSDYFLYPLYYKIPDFISHLYERMQKEVNSQEEEEEKDKDFDIIRIAGRNAALLGERYPKIFFNYLYSKIENLNNTGPEKQEFWFYYTFNVALYALQSNKPKAALQLFQNLKEKKFSHFYMPVLESLGLWLNGSKRAALHKQKAFYFYHRTDRIVNYNLGQMYRLIHQERKALPLLLKAAFLLDKSQGMESQSRIFNKAESLFKQKQYQRALHYFTLIIEENPNNYPLSYMYIGQILWKQDKRKKAVEHFNEMFKKNQYKAIAEDELKKIYKQYLKEAEDFLQIGNELNASDIFIDAFTVVPSLYIVDKIIELNKELNRSDIVMTYQNEKNKLEQKIKEREEKRAYIEKIKEIRKQRQEKNYEQAITSLYQVLVYKETKAEFMLLAKLLQQADRLDELEEINKRWHAFLERQEQETKLKKDQNRLERKSNKK